MTHRLFCLTRLAAAIALALGASLPATAGLYDGAADATALEAAFAGWQTLKKESDSLWWAGSISIRMPDWGDWFNQGDSTSSFVILFPQGWVADWLASADADLGAAGAPVYLGSQTLRLGAGFDTWRDFVIGYTLASPFPRVEYDGQASGQPAVEPVRAGGGVIDTAGHDFGIHGRITAHEVLVKQGAGTLRVTNSGNVWLAAPVVAQGRLSGDAPSLDTDIHVGSGAQLEFVQAVDAIHARSVSGDGDVVKRGAATLTLDAPQSFAGTLRLEEGRLALGAAASLESAREVDVAAAATLDLRARTQPTRLRLLTGAGNVELGDGDLWLRGADRWMSGVDDGPDVFDGSLSGAGRLVIDALADVELRGNNSQARGTRVEGTLRAGRDTSLGAAQRALELRGGRLVATRGFTLRRAIDSTGDSVIDTGAHGLVLDAALSGSGSLLKAGSGSLMLTRAGRYEGNLHVAGTLALRGAGSTGAGSRLLLGAGARFDISQADGARAVAGLDSMESDSRVLLGGNALHLDVADHAYYGGRMDGSGDLVKTGAGTQWLYGAGDFSGTTRVREGVLEALPQSVGTRVVNDAVVRMHVGAGGAQAWSGELSGSGRFVKTGGGLLWLRGGNTQAKVVVEGGALAGRSASLGGDIDVEHGAGVAFYIDGNDTHSGRIAGAGTLYSYGDGVLTLAGSYSHSGGTAVSNTLRIDSDARLGAAEGALLLAGGTLQAQADMTLNRHVALGVDGGRIDTDGHDIVLNGDVTGPGGLTKTGDGRLTLAGAYSYAGLTLVEAGELSLTGVLDGSFEVMAGARLTASGVVGGDIISSGGDIVIGSSGVRAGSIILGGTMTFNIAASGAGSAMLSAGSLSIGSGAAIRVQADDLFLRPGGQITLLAAGGISVLDAGSIRLDDRLVAAGYSVSVSDAALTLVAAPVPEPSQLALLLAGLGLAGWRARRRMAG
ncbi:MAG: autotransporter-associated beta strand repeat-containing protein [Gammaproteobacteria bacterium]|nr:autotransporter-associated beta strand repeat-containing protein [Gammaproteobacteria bacterium]MBU0771002.1 autotransporter-associated beta strand repeat-containing protein [Gammaproteobacteria bacterium]MBU0857800.1 autotransporter-associated beta strand repeat-containing protein [Gammaproteobacteria bacterium]MBU1846046.1 autotransporter-associated beta strand repeat-containing protein [Gammaproteobacteria bacterium]